MVEAGNLSVSYLVIGDALPISLAISLPTLDSQ
jgi:hypothetical protein